jgi:hypothetical protein
MQNHDPTANGSSLEFSRDGLAPRKTRRQDTQEALDVMRLRLDALTAKISKLELGMETRRAFWRREIGDAAIITALLILSGIIGFSLLSRFF